MTAQSAFTPGATITATVTTSSVATALPKPVGGSQVRVAAVAGGIVGFMKFGDSAVAATTGDTPILPGSVELFTVPSSATHVAFISTGAGNTFYVTSGYGA